jgi:Na+/proline symporter
MADVPQQLLYRSGRDESLPPSAGGLLLGVFLILLAIAATSLGGLVLMFSVSGAYAAGASRGPVMMLLFAFICFASNLWLVPRAAKLFRRRPPAGSHA